MIRKILAVGLLSGFFVAPAFAGHCPLDIAAIDSALENTTLDSEVKAQVKALRDEGRALHEAGDHGDSEKKLAEAMRLILNNL